MAVGDWHTDFDTDLTWVSGLSRAVIKSMMKARFGRITSIGSVVGSMGNAGQVNYVAAKAGLVGFTKALAREVGSRNITVNCVAPGFIETDMTKALAQAQVAKLVEDMPLGGRGQGKRPPVVAVVGRQECECWRRAGEAVGRGVREVCDRIGGARVRGQAGVGQIETTGVAVESDVFQQRAEAARGIVDFRLGLL